MSNVTNFQTLLAFTMWHIRTNLHQFLISSFRDFVRTDRLTDAQTDAAKNNRWRAGTNDCTVPQSLTTHF